MTDGQGEEPWPALADTCAECGAKIALCGHALERMVKTACDRGKALESDLAACRSGLLAAEAERDAFAAVAVALEEWRQARDAEGDVVNSDDDIDWGTRMGRAHKRRQDAEDAVEQAHDRYRALGAAGPRAGEGE